MKYFLTISLFLHLNAQTVHLNEIVSSNNTTLYDEDGDSPDWIEIHNASNETIDLLDYGLSDDNEDPYKWKFPSMQIAPNGYSIIFASNKDRSDLIQSWDAILDIGDLWHYWVGNSAPISNWMQSETDISDWPFGASGFGYGDNDDNTVISQTTSVYVRKTFNISDLSIISKILFHLDYDDGYVAYINGVEFSRQNLGASESQINFNTTSTALHEAEIYSGGFPSAVIIDPDLFPVNQGENTLAIQVHNYSNTSSDLSCIPFLTFGYNTEVQNLRVPDERMELPNTFLHTNFKISSSGEDILLSDNMNQRLDSIYSGQIQTDMSLGKIIEEETWALFSEPTPGEENLTSSFLGILQKPSFSIESGFYNDNQLILEINQENEFSNTYYTLDGSDPDQNSTLYDAPFSIIENSVVRAKSFLENWYSSDTESKTYILGEDAPGDLPVIFLTTDHNSFFDQDTGLYVMGPSASNDFPYFGSNFWEDWERPIHFELVDPNREGYAADAGVKIFGGWSRAFPQKSLSFFSRSYLGPSSFEYSFFPNSDISSYEAFVLRNSGNDWESTVLRDGFTTSLTENLNIDHQQYRPAVLYINGDFWGIQNLREKINEHFIASNHNIDAQYVDLLVGGGFLDEEIVHGTNTDYINLIGYVESNDMNDDIVENAIENWVDIESFLSYFAFQIFIDNRDWPGNNIKFWRDHRTGGQWRWILYDTDFGFGIWDANAYSFNTLSFALEENGPNWPNPPWSTFLFRKIISNDNFKNRFISIYCDLLNTTFKSENLLNHLDSIKSNIEYIIPQHHNRWFNNGSWPNSATNWEDRISNIENFSQYRQNYAKSHIRNQFDLGSIEEITIMISPENSGFINYNSLRIQQNEWTGSYFPDVPVKAQAVPNEGYEFSHWEEFPDSSSIIFLSTIPNLLTAVFIESNLNPGEIVINEINYNSNDEHDTGDWIELVNIGPSISDISGWVLKDDDDNHSFVFPEGTTLNQNEFIVIAQDNNLFESLHPSLNNVLGPLGFGLGGGGDQVRIFNDSNTLIDSLEYDDEMPWPSAPDGDGYTLELINTSLDNSSSISWISSNELYGTPGFENSSDLQISTKPDILPNDPFLLDPYPNPFNGYIQIPIILKNINSEKVYISNIKGEIINEISIKHLNPGLNNLIWDGTNQRGFNISTGIYFINLKSSKRIDIQKIIYLK